MEAQRIMGDGPQYTCMERKCRHSFYKPKVIVNPNFPKGENAWIIAHRKRISYEISVCPECGSKEILGPPP